MSDIDADSGDFLMSPKLPIEGPIEKPPKTSLSTLTQDEALSSVVEETRVFSKFPEFPVELQLQIWKAALPAARLVALWLKTWQIKDGTLEDTPEDLHKFLCKNPPPTILHINRQSREVGLKSFTLQIKTPIQKCPIYINPDIDTIYTCNFIASADERFRNIRQLAIPFANDRTVPVGCSDGYCGESGDLITRLRKMPCLMDVALISHHGRCLLHIEKQFTSIDFSHLGASTLSTFARMWDMEVALEKALYPEWKVPKFYEKRLVMPDGKLTCRTARQDPQS